MKKDLQKYFYVINDITKRYLTLITYLDKLITWPNVSTPKASLLHFPQQPYIRLSHMKTICEEISKAPLHYRLMVELYKFSLSLQRVQSCLACLCERKSCYHQVISFTAVEGCLNNLPIWQFHDSSRYQLQTFHVWHSRDRWT